MPVKVADLMSVSFFKRKSSADSISKLPPPVSGRVAVPIFPSGFPVLKKNRSARAMEIELVIATTAAIVANTFLIRYLLGFVNSAFKSFSFERLQAWHDRL